MIIRLALEADRAGVEALCTHIWDGHDYLPILFTDWLADPSGELYVATRDAADDSQIIGTGKITCFGPGDWWFEGLRVHPDFRNQGIGRSLIRYGIRRAEALGSGSLRFATAQSNRTMHKLAAQAGFSLVGHYVRYAAGAMNNPESAGHFRRFGEAEFSQVWKFLEVSPHFARAQRSVKGIWWAWHFLTPDELQEHLADSLVYGWYGSTPDSLGGVIILNPFPEDLRLSGRPLELRISYLDAATGSLAVFAQAVRTLAWQLDCQKAEYFLFVRPERLVAFEQAGWRRVSETDEISLYSRPLHVAGDSGIDP